MRVHHVKRIWSKPLFIRWGKYVCPVCGEKLQKVKNSKIVNSQSVEAKDYDFSSPGDDGYMIGNVKFIWTEFFCSKCRKSYAVDDFN